MAHTVSHIPGRTESRTTDSAGALRTVALLFGIAFLAVGVAGFVPGLTSNVGDMKFAAHDSPAELFNTFQVSVLHNIVHILFGLVGLAAARRWPAARAYLVIGGLIYLALAVYGVAVDKGTDANFVPVNDADDWLHLGLGAVMLLSGLALRPHRDHDLDRGRTARDADVRY